MDGEVSLVERVVTMVKVLMVIRRPLSHPLHLVDGEGALRRLLLVTSAPVDLHIICYHLSFYIILNIIIYSGLNFKLSSFALPATPLFLSLVSILSSSSALHGHLNVAQGHISNVGPIEQVCKRIDHNLISWLVIIKSKS